MEDCPAQTIKGQRVEDKEVGLLSERWQAEYAQKREKMQMGQCYFERTWLIVREAQTKATSTVF